VAGIQWDNFDGKFYQPYNKREKIGKVCDFVTAAQMALNLSQAQAKPPKAVAVKEVFEEDEKGFEVVEEETVIKKKQKPTAAQAARGGQRPY